MDEYFIVALLKKYINRTYSGFKELALENRDINGEIRNYLTFKLDNGSINEIDITNYIKKNEIKDHLDDKYAQINDEQITLDNVWSASKIKQFIDDLRNKVDNGDVIGSSTHVSVKSFGAVGDGVTDDTIAINKCISYCASNNLIVYFPKAVYRAKNIDIKSNTTIDGGFSTIKNTDEKFVNGSTGNLIFSGWVKDIRNIKISNIILDGNSSVLVRDEDINDKKGPILLWLYECRNVILENIVFQNNILSGFAVYNAKNISVHNCKFFGVDCGIITFGNTINNLHVSNCHFDGHEMSEPISLYIYDNTVSIEDDVYGDDIIIEQCTFKNKTGTAGVAFGRNGSYSRFSNVKILNNTWYNCNNGVNFYSESENVEICGNRFENRRGILFGKNTNRTKIINNTFYSMSGTPMIAAIGFKGNKSIISGNHFIDVKSADTLTGNYSKYYEVVGMLSLNGDGNIYRNNTHAINDGNMIQSITISGNKNIICLDEPIVLDGSNKTLNIFLGVNYLHSNEARTREFKTVAESADNKIYITGSKFTLTNCFTDGATASIGSNKVINVLDNTTLSVTNALYGGVVS